MTTEMFQHTWRFSFFLFFLFFINCATIELPKSVNQVTDGGIIELSLSNYNKSIKEDQAFIQLVNIDKSTNLAINVNDIPIGVTFIIIQAHAHLYNISMSYAKTTVNDVPGKSITGTNIGLFVETTDSRSTSVYVTNGNNFQVDSLIAVVAYTNDAPYSGGCNMEFEIEKSPFQKLIYSKATVTVDAQPASVPKIGNVQPICEKYPLQHDAYRMYLPEQDFSNETYFLAIANMLTVRDIQKNADPIPASLFGSAMRRVYSLYSGTGSVYGMIAHFANRSSAYVPITTYGCDPSSGSPSCSHLTTSFEKVLCAITFFIGMFVAMRGQYFFKISMFLLGMVTGGYIGWTIGVSIGTFDVTGLMLIAIFISIITSLIWLLLWMTLSSPIPSLIFSGLSLGSLLFFIFYFSVPAGALYLEVDAYFWLLYTTTIIVVILTFSVIPLTGNILCFTVLGAYASVLSIDYYSNSNLKYILVNSIRRITVDNFKVAVIDPPCQDKDILLVIFWVFLVILGLYKQCATNWNRTPFPPSISHLVHDTERTSLLPPSRYQQKYGSSNRNNRRQSYLQIFSD
ncbi:transmembrane 7 superfamily member 3-like [Phymastichus coffea]|uniref:transmembrane 7 superfamily member 3-like n=1 Tax=Phymastichus coffea TaxID=108790 RepID=UPI00273C9429|nr:transmembrane 7 superfamily member 3-like [Phymastichus coffea]